MASITIRQLDDAVKAKLRVRAATNGRSMEEEARVILREAVEEKASKKGLGTRLHELFKPFGGVELEIPPREPMRDPPRFG
ncbi:MAG: plasmid stabilization protein [Gemmatimonadetes bacterium]|nr:plasmid stabilization protein [Gemmatimonadota bacterium]MYG35517.1 plasmid stabilization protein [Gemmatimonadota bacterium]